MKAFIFAAAALAIAGSGFTYAALAAPDGPTERHQKADWTFIFDAKLAGMKTALALTSEQEKLWPAFETALRDARKGRQEGREEGEERPSPIERLTLRSERLAKNSQSLKALADAAKPLFDSLDEGQKRHFGYLLHMVTGHEGGRDGYRRRL